MRLGMPTTVRSGGPPLPRPAMDRVDIRDFLFLAHAA